MFSDKCVYCGGIKPFTKEHIFPVSLGGDDKKFILNEGVCGECNNFFSRLELKLARNHFVGFNRLLRTTPKNTSKQELNFCGKYLDGVSKVFFEGIKAPLEVAFPRTGYVGSQIIIDGDMWYYILPPEVSEEEFFNKEVGIFSLDKLELIKKRKYMDKSIFYIQKLFWDGSKYVKRDAYEDSNPPEAGVWLEDLVGTEKDFEELPRIVVTRDGSVRLRCNESTDLAETCRLARRFVKNAKRQTKVIRSDTKRSVFTMSVSVEEAQRALAKIAFNFLIHRIGYVNASIPWFGKIKKYILNGKKYEKVSYIVGTDAQKLSRHLFGDCPESYHVACLTIEPEGGNRYNIFFYARLYGKDIFSIMLGSLVPLPDGAPNGIAEYYVVDYNSNNISSYSWREFNSLFKVSKNKLSPDEILDIGPGMIIGDRDSPLIDRKYIVKKKRKKFSA